MTPTVEKINVLPWQPSWMFDWLSCMLYHFIHSSSIVYIFSPSTLVTLNQKIICCEFWSTKHKIQTWITCCFRRISFISFGRRHFPMKLLASEMARKYEFCLELHSQTAGILIYQRLPKGWIRWTNGWPTNRKSQNRIEIDILHCVYRNHEGAISFSLSPWFWPSAELVAGINLEAVLFELGLNQMGPTH